MRSRLFHLFLEGAHTLGIDPALHRSTGDEGAEADAALIKPSKVSCASAWRTVVRVVSKLSASSVSDGRRSPAANRPEAICVRSISWMRKYKGAVGDGHSGLTSSCL